MFAAGALAIGGFVRSRWRGGRSGAMRSNFPVSSSPYRRFAAAEAPAESPHNPVQPTRSTILVIKVSEWVEIVFSILISSDNISDSYTVACSGSLSAERTSLGTGMLTITEVPKPLDSIFIFSVELTYTLSNSPNPTPEPWD